MAVSKLKPKVKDEEESSGRLEEALTSEVSPSDEAEDEVYTLPAGYVDENGTTHTEFTIRDIIGKDEEAIHKADVKANGSKVVSTLLTRCVTRIGTLTPKSVGGSDKWANVIKSLLVGDQDYMLVQLRKKSIGDEIEANHICPNPSCKAKLTTFLSLDELEFVPFDGERVIPFSLTRGYKDRKGVVHKEGTLRLPTGLDREILTPLAKSNLAKAETTMLTRVCKFNDGAYVDDDVMSNLTIKDREYLMKLLREHLFGYKFEVEVTCSSCGETFKGSLNAANFI